MPYNHHEIYLFVQVYEKDCEECDMHPIGNEKLVMQCETEADIGELQEQVNQFMFLCAYFVDLSPPLSTCFSSFIYKLHKALFKGTYEIWVFSP